MKHLALVLIALVSSIDVDGARFVNLDFELASTNGIFIERRKLPKQETGYGIYPYGTGPAEQLLPGWQVFVGGQRMDTVAIGNGFLDSSKLGTHVALMIPGDYWWTLIGTMEGKYAVVLNNVARGDLANVAVVRISQRGDVPEEAFWLRFRQVSWAPVLQIDDGTRSLSFAIPSTPTPLSPDKYVLDPKDPTRLYANISPLAGKTVALSFHQWGDGIIALDSIEFLKRPRIEAVRQGGQVILSWEGPLKLTASPTIDGPFTPVAGASSPHTVTSEGTMFFRLELRTHY